MSASTNAGTPAVSLTREDSMHTALEGVDMGDPDNIEIVEASIKEVLTNADNAINKESQMATNNTATDHSNPDPRRNFYKSVTASSNMLERLLAEERIIIANVEDIDRRIAELQAERTDNMLAASGLRRAITSIEEGSE